MKKKVVKRNSSLAMSEKSSTWISIFLLDLVTITVLGATVFSSFQLSDAPLQWDPSPLYYPSFFYLSPPRVDQMVGFCLYPISTFPKLLVVAVRLNLTVQASLPH